MHVVRASTEPRGLSFESLTDLACRCAIDLDLWRNLERDLADARSEAELRGVRDRYLARKGGLVSALLKALGQAPPADRPRLGQLVNELKTRDRDRLAERLALGERRAPAGRSRRHHPAGPRARRSATAIR